MPEANANPDKRFFIDLIIRDISLEDAILDLIDNAIDSLVRSKHIDLYKDFLASKNTHNKAQTEIKINYSNKQFKIEDNCGGISIDRAQNDVFRFGRPEPNRGMSLSVFGIGMKRAIFKIGRQIEIKSRAFNSGFDMRLNADTWLNDQSYDWKIPLEVKEGENILSKAGTKITITRLREEVSILTQNPTFQNKLIKTIQETYPFYLGKVVNIIVNEKDVEGIDLTFGESDKIKSTKDEWEEENVKATMICGLLPRKFNQWTFEKSGWYILCNGRVIVHADKTRLTGWGDTLPQFMPKNRGFLGIVFFQSNHPEDLPWNTTKRGINSESSVYIHTLKERMIPAAKLVIQFQNKIYSSIEGEEPKEEYRDSVKDLQTFSATKNAAERSIETKQSQLFSFHTQQSPPKLTNIQFKVKIDDLDRVKKRLGRKSMTNKEVGEKIFKYYMDRECSQ